MRVGSCQEAVLGGRATLLGLLALPPGVRVRTLHALAMGFWSPKDKPKTEAFVAAVWDVSAGV